MIHFEFTLEDAEAEFLRLLFQQDIDRLEIMRNNEYSESTKQWFENAKKFNQSVKQKVLENHYRI